MIAERIKETNPKDIFLKIVLPACDSIIDFYFKAFFTEGA